MSVYDFLIAAGIAVGVIAVGGVVWALVRAGDDDLEENSDEE